LRSSPGGEDIKKHRTLHFGGNDGTLVKKSCFGVRNNILKIGMHLSPQEQKVKYTGTIYPFHRKNSYLAGKKRFRGKKKHEQEKR